MTNTIEIGDRVQTVFAWRENEQPTANNFFTGEVLEVIQRGEHNTYYRISGYNGLRPADTVKLIEKAETENVPYVHVSQSKALAMLDKSYSKGWRGYITATNLDRTEFEITSGDNEYQVKFRYSDASDEVFATCECLYFQNTKKICKHISIASVEELYSTFEQRRAA